jgi:nitric oxide reductase subunit C
MIGFIILLVGVGLLAGCSAGGEAAPPTPTYPPLINQGRQVFNTHCASCHSLAPGTVIVGPSLAQLAANAGTRVQGFDTKTYIETSILKPDAFIVEGYAEAMPQDLAKKITGEDFDALVAFLLTLE